MNILVLYASSHGRTRQVVFRFAEQLPLPCAIHNVKDDGSSKLILACELLVCFCPTYGDEELQDDMERFLECNLTEVEGKRFVICELGNYYGYDDFSFGALHVLRKAFLELKGVEFFEPLSLDSFPEWTGGSYRIGHVV